MSIKKQSNEELVAKIQAGQNPAANMALLWQQNEPFVKKVANKYKAYAEFEDLVQEGYFGICQAVEGFDNNYGVKFLTYAETCISRCMQKYIAGSTQMIRLPESAGESLRKYKAIQEQFETKFERKPTGQELSYYLGVSEKELETIRKAERAKSIASLSVPVGDDGDSTLIDMLAADDESLEEDVARQVDREQMKETVWSVVNELPDNLPLVIHERFVSGKTLKEIGVEIGVSLDRVRQLESKAMRELRRPKNSRRVKPYFDEYLSACCYRHVGVEHFQRTGMSSTEYAVFKMLNLDKFV